MEKAFIYRCMYQYPCVKNKETVHDIHRPVLEEEPGSDTGNRGAAKGKSGTADQGTDY